MSSSAARTVAAASLAAAVLTVALPLPAAYATGGSGAPGKPGRASAVTAELDLDVTLLNTVDVPVNVALNKVQTPARRDDAMLTAKVEGVDQNRPVTLVKAQVGQSVTRADDKGATASVKLVGADLHAPGMPLTTLLGLEALSAEASCPVDGPPTAKVVAPAEVTVLGRPVAVGLNSPTRVDLPAIGSVEVEFSKKSTTTSTAAASALEVQVRLNPLNLNVAKVDGRITVASVSCEKPVPASAPSSAAPSPASDGTAAARAVPAQGGGGELASTGASGTVPLLAGGATLLVTGGAALWMTRRRRAAHARRR
ncbi:SCO1860 family LAETG-anchored protein [Kitasatospora terrestris]|uniref:SCO1860 family LAETG-anchored protein n=1 Tax=Kitasatospora terrestris TaxID=258051 RepID=A0ABP9EA30_9ACTN